MSFPVYYSGIGYDVHPLVEGRKLVLGGVHIPYARGLKGHSDADVLVHAIMDAILGAAGLGDIGEHFPDTSRKYKGASSLLLLKQVGAMAVKAVVEKYGVNRLACMCAIDRATLTSLMEYWVPEVSV